jgi:hypothetical protein
MHRKDAQWPYVVRALVVIAVIVHAVIVQASSSTLSSLMLLPFTP